MLQGAAARAQKCRNTSAPNFLQRVNNAARKRHPCDTLKGAITQSQQCRALIAPTSFIWCQLRIAAMPIEQRTKGRAVYLSRKCLDKNALPTQFNGVIVKTQKCLDIVAPRGEPSKVRRDVSIVPLSPTSLRGH